MNSDSNISKSNYYKLVIFNILFLALSPIMFMAILLTIQPFVGLLMLGIVMLFGNEAADGAAESLSFISIPLSMLITLVGLVIIWKLFDRKFLSRYKKGAV